jgi:hypothetical protein
MEVICKGFETQVLALGINLHNSDSDTRTNVSSAMA